MDLSLNTRLLNLIGDTALRLFRKEHTGRDMTEQIPLSDIVKLIELALKIFSKLFNLPINAAADRGRNRLDDLADVGAKEILAQYAG